MENPAFRSVFVTKLKIGKENFYVSENIDVPKKVFNLYSSAKSSNDIPRDASYLIKLMGEKTAIKFKNNLDEKK